LENKQTPYIGLLHVKSIDTEKFDFRIKTFSVSASIDHTVALHYIKHKNNKYACQI